jgi:hypothetical protein
MEKPKRRPGDLLLDRYFPNADEETRERAREGFRRYALLLIKIGERLEREEAEADSSKPETDSKISPTL